ncbi:MAG: ABC transporter ATP-binding protein/permease [Rhodobacteraceae bacterium]|nr:ABC transporter ATP-binding protein/permease [Paracoccaceae bacterium]
MALAFALMVVEGSTLGALSWMIEPLFDRVFVAGEAQAIWWVGGAILGLFLLRAVSSVAFKTLMSRIAQRSTTAMQVDLLRHLLRLDAAFFQANPPGALMERVQGDTLAVQGVWAVVISGVGRDVVSLVSLAVVAILIDPWWTLLAVVAMPALIAPAVIAQRYIRKKTAAMRATSGDRSTQLDEVFHGIVPIKLNALEAYQMGRFGRIVDRIVRANVKIEASRAVIPALIDVITGVGFFLVLVVGGQEILSGEKSLGQFMSFFTAMALTFQPLRRLGALTGIWQVAAASLERLYRLFDTEPTILSPPVPRPAPADTEIRVEDVALAFGDMPVLRGVSFVAEAGRTTALVGASGAGKSTLFNVLTRMVDPERGRVTVGGTDIREMDLATLRALFSVVTQDALLFDETIRENILLGRTDVDPARLAQVLEDAHVSDFVAQLPKGLDSPAGPRGSNLSGGQRQRVAIARALLRDTPILLLDEATSALDAASEAVVQAALERLSRGRTTLVIAHRLATIRGADKIVVLDRGRVVDEGRHEELIARGGLYAELCRLQFGED